MERRALELSKKQDPTPPMKLPSNIRRLLSMTRPYRGRLSLAFLGMIVTAATEPSLAWMMRLLLDHGFKWQLAFPLWLVPACVIGIFALRGVSTLDRKSVV